MKNRQKTLLLAVFVLFCLLPHPAFATGSEGPRASHLILINLATMSPGLLLALALTRGGISQRLLSLLAPLIVGGVGAPLFYLLTLLGGWWGPAVSVAVPLAAAWFVSRPKALKPDAPAKPGKKKIGIFHVYFVLAVPLVLFFLWKEGQYQYAQFLMRGYAKERQADLPTGKTEWRP